MYTRMAPLINWDKMNTTKLLAPVVLFTYNRPKHTQHTLDALSANTLATKTDVIVYSDAPKSIQDIPVVEEIRKLILRYTPAFKSLSIQHRPYNFGLSRSIIDGITEVFQTHDRVIVLEDDLVTSPHFLTYMNDGLTLYQDTPLVGSIHGYMYPTDTPLSDTFFVRGGDCWGWGTWKHVWTSFEQNGKVLLQTLKSQNLTRAFDLNGAYPFTTMLNNQIAEKIQSWAIRWHAHLFIHQHVTLYPRISLVQNIGFDHSGTSQDKSTQFEISLATSPPVLTPLDPIDNPKASEAIASFWRQTRPKSIWKLAYEFLHAI